MSALGGGLNRSTRSLMLKNISFGFAAAPESESFSIAGNRDL
jgi:hypothetical protein